MAIQAFAQAAMVLESEATPEPRAFPVEGCPPSEYLQAALQVAFAAHCWCSSLTSASLPSCSELWCHHAPLFCAAFFTCIFAS